MDLNFLKNPILLAMIAATITYLYLWWKNKKDKEEGKTDVQEVPYMIPIAVGLITLFITYNLFGTTSPITTEPAKVTLLENNPTVAEGGMTDTFGSNTYHLVGKNNIKLPQTDVFIDIARF